MSITLRFLLAILLTIGTGFYFMVDWLVDDLKPQYRELTEDPLVDAAGVLARLAATTARDGAINVALFQDALRGLSTQRISARIYDFVKTDVDVRVYITDTAGVVIYDSDNGRDEGEDYSQWNDVYLTLRGKYGSRTSRDIPGQPDTSMLYVAAPIRVEDDLLGVLSVGKSARNVNMLVDASKNKIIFGCVATFVMVVLAALTLTTMITRPIQRLTAYAKAIGQRERKSLPRLGNSEIKSLGEAFEEMRVALEGKKYVEHYVQNLTHEMKSPLAGIQGAVELLREEMPAERRVRFLDNIQGDVARMREVVDKLLLLASLENRRDLVDVQEIDPFEVVAELTATLQSQCEGKGKGITFQITGGKNAKFMGEPFLVRHAVMNILQNAFDFSPAGGVILIKIRSEPTGIRLCVEDQGPGIPEYASARVFERFYSLKRPDTGKKSSGLGLSLVHEAMVLHNGSVQLENIAGSGARATLLFPVG